MKNRMAKKSLGGTGLIVMQVVLSSSLCAAGGFSSMAVALSRAAQANHIRRVAVLPFLPDNGGGDAAQGLEISENLTTSLVQEGRVKVVERALLGQLQKENRLDLSGAVDLATVHRMGQVAAPNAVVTGSFEQVGDKEIINARLIQAETGVILAAVSRRIKMEMPQDDWANSRQEIYVPPPALFVPVPTIDPDSMPEVSDNAPENGEDCSGASGRIDSLEQKVLDLKARYWAIQLKKGVSFSSLKFNPGSEISDPDLKQQFYGRMQYWYSQGDIPALAPSEVHRLLSIDGRAFSLYERCGA